MAATLSRNLKPLAKRVSNAHSARKFDAHLDIPLAKDVEAALTGSVVEITEIAPPDAQVADHVGKVADGPAVAPIVNVAVGAVVAPVDVADDHVLPAPDHVPAAPDHDAIVPPAQDHVPLNPVNSAGMDAADDLLRLHDIQSQLQVSSQEQIKFQERVGILAELDRTHGSEHPSVKASRCKLYLELRAHAERHRDLANESITLNYKIKIREKT